VSISAANSLSRIVAASILYASRARAHQVRGYSEAKNRPGLEANSFFRDCSQ